MLRLECQYILILKKIKLKKIKLNGNSAYAYSLRP
jgi:hypothetical protein